MMQPFDESPNIRLIAMPHLGIDRGRIDRYVPEGGTVADHVRALGWHPEALSARVFIDGDYIAQTQWEYAVPKAGQFLSLRVIPTGGAGSGGKDALRIVAIIGVVIAAALSAGAGGVGLGGLLGVSAANAGAVGGAIISSTVTIAGSLALGGLIPHPLPRRAAQWPIEDQRRKEAA